ncbi:chorismate--pyruvate lyase family protein [Endozoicomonadaceae bacterium StTr2]
MNQTPVTVSEPDRHAYHVFSAGHGIEPDRLDRLYARNRHVSHVGYRDIAPEDLPDELQDWLLYPGSLTRRLQRAFPGTFEVKVLRQEWDIPTSWESRFLGTAPRRIANIREVLLICNNQPRVYARSVLPWSSLNGENRNLLSLGSKPLGEFLFTRANVKRECIEVSRLPVADLHPCLEQHYAGNTQVWGRHSRFRLNGKPLSVYEAFLPDRV